MHTEKPLAGKVALVTGASRGIGLAIAHALARLGAALGICSRDAKQLAAATSQLKESATEVLPIPADITRTTDIDTLVERTEKELGPIEVLVNNAGVGYFGPFQQASEANLDSLLDTIL
jgi:3-oxoacyl-[acyl-carrier protein] reductase